MGASSYAGYWKLSTTDGTNGEILNTLMCTVDISSFYDNVNVNIIGFKIREITCGGDFQLKLSPGYIKDATDRCDLNDVMIKLEEPGLVKVKLHSRYGSKLH